MSRLGGRDGMAKAIAIAAVAPGGSVAVGAFFVLRAACNASSPTRGRHCSAAVSSLLNAVFSDGGSTGAFRCRQMQHLLLVDAVAFFDNLRAHTPCPELTHGCRPHSAGSALVMDEVEHYRAGVPLNTRFHFAKSWPNVAAHCILLAHGTWATTQAQLRTRVCAIKHVRASAGAHGNGRRTPHFPSDGSSVTPCTSSNRTPIAHLQVQIASDHANFVREICMALRKRLLTPTHVEREHALILSCALSGIGCVVESNDRNGVHVSVVVKGGAAHQSGIQEVLPWHA